MTSDSRVGRLEVELFNDSQSPLTPSSTLPPSPMTVPVVALLLPSTAEGEVYENYTAFTGVE